MLRECPRCYMNKVSTEDAWEQCHCRQRDLVEANRRLADQMTITRLLIALLFTAIVVGCSPSHSYLTPASAGTVTPIGGNQVEATTPTTRRTFTVEADGRVTP